MNKAFRVIGLLEGTSFLLLLFIATPIKYFAANDSYVKMLGMPHGILFLIYVTFSILLKYKLNWKSKTFLIILGASIVPFGTFYTDKKYLQN